MPKIADWPPTRADAQHILSQHLDALPEHLHTCKVCGDTYWGKPANNGRIRSFCSKRCYYKHNESSPAFQRYRVSPKGKAMRQRVNSKSGSRPEAIAQASQRYRWVKFVLTLDPSQRPFDTTPWPTCTTEGCCNINSRRNFTRCTWCSRQSALARSWRNAGKPCKGGCGKPLTRYQQHTCLDSECVKIYQRNNPDFVAKRRIVSKRRRARKRAAFVENVDVMILFQWQEGRCYHCNRKIDIEQTAPHPKSLTLDHLVPLALGGDHSYANTVASCWKCNCSVKGVRAIGEQLKLV